MSPWRRKIMFGEVGLELTDAQWLAVHRRIHELAGRSRWYVLMQMLPGMLPLVAIPFWLAFRRHFGLWWNAVVERGV